MSEKKLLSGHKVVALSEEEQEEMATSEFLQPSVMVRLEPDGWLVPDVMAEKYLDKIYTFKFRPDDLVVMSYPKSGTTWLQEVLWTMVHNPDLTHKETNTPILDRSPDISFDFIFDSPVSQFLTFDSFRRWFSEVCPGRDSKDGLMLQICELMSGRRIIKCHIPFSLMPPDLLETAKVVYVARNPMDIVVSYYSMMVNLGMLPEIATIQGFPAFEKFVHYFMRNNLIFSPYWTHVEEAWRRQHHPNLYMVTYEQLKADNMKHLRKLNDFIGTNLTQEQLDAVEKHTSFKSMKERGDPMRDGLLRNFFRNGKAGDWRNYFTDRLEEEMKDWIEENNLCGIKYDVD